MNQYNGLSDFKNKNTMVIYQLIIKKLNKNNKKNNKKNNRKNNRKNNNLKHNKNNNKNRNKNIFNIFLIYINPIKRSHTNNIKVFLKQLIYITRILKNQKIINSFRSQHGKNINKSK